MRFICSFCGRELAPPEEGPGAGTLRRSCDQCLAAFASIWCGWHPDPGWAERFEGQPLFVVTGELRLVWMNRRAGALLGTGLAAVRGLVCGEFLACEHGYEPEGCGGTRSCRHCSLRAAIAYTHRSGKPQDRVPATMVLKRAGEAERCYRMAVSTAKVKEAVSVRIEEAVLA